MIFLSLSIKTAYANISLISQMTQSFDVIEGESYQGLLKLYNNGDQVQDVRIYQTDYRFDAEGHSFYEKAGTLARSNAGWIEINNSIVSVPPKESINLPYRIIIPEDKNLVGTYWSMIMVEPLPIRDSTGSANSLMEEEQDVKIGVKQSFRYGVQIVTNLGDDGKYKLNFTNSKLRYDEKRDGYIFQVDLINKGEYWLSPVVWMEIYDDYGSQVGRFKGRQLRIYPDTSIRQQIRVAKLRAGTYQALLIADNQDDNIFGIRYTLKVTEP